MLQDVLLIVGITTLCMVSPGPDMALVIRNTLLSSRGAGMATSAGILTGNFVHIAYCALGVGYVVAQSIVVYSALRYAGAIYLIVLGIQTLRASLDEPMPNSPAEGDSGGVTRVKAPFVQGLVNNLLNPKGALFYMGVFTQVIEPSGSWVHTGVLIATMVATSALFWVVFVSTLERPWVRERLARSKRAVERLFGALLIALGLRVALD